MAAAGTADASVQGPAGRYVMGGQRRGVLTLTPDGEAWRISLSGGALSDGAATAADCELQAEGALRNGRIEGKVVPFEGANISLSAADLATRPAKAEVTLKAETAIVTTDFQGCGVGADLSGRYVRQAPGAISEGDSVADLSAALPDARLTILDGYPWARFAIERDGKRLAVVQFDGENEELADGRNSQQAIGAQLGWSALKPALRVVKVEGGAS
ncbi:hypothetical protein [Caulobacter endophyticus]|uniref:Uncharacterized protein n=1 Tax=Caulobacter endophyticus TaxID=2172652 RepID=A0A2T9JTZ2_9CAUL|nr:hypothetical protein [Caulobacter endophyticus]PVM87195.1 hypothetical protein DDF67_14930 [Caulobacter endophyticus]